MMFNAHVLGASVPRLAVDAAARGAGGHAGAAGDHGGRARGRVVGGGESGEQVTAGLALGAVLELLGGVAPGLEDGVGGEAVADQPPAVRGAADVVDPAAADEPVVGDLVVVEDIYVAVLASARRTSGRVVRNPSSRSHCAM